ncbi:CHAT domain-containing protein [Dactylosporangium sp. CA-052675]|uniref:CHAT domain-containing protein n=1 Tax=Dactylosporangium sp. CA-052675 TaxID=3239927 RepID=UPI003D948BBB
MDELRSWLERAAGSEDPDVVLDPAALAVLRRAALGVDPDDLDTALLIGLGHWLRYLRLPEGEDEADLDRAAHWLGLVFPWAPDQVPPSMHEGLARTVPPAGTDPDAWSAEAARLLTSRWGRAPALLERAIRLLREAAARGRGPQRAVYLVNLCSAEQNRFRATGDVSAVDEAVAAGSEAVRVAAADILPAAEGNLGAALRVRYETLGRDADLTAAVEHGRAALAAAPPDDPRDATYRSSLSCALQARYDRYGDPDDLGEAIALGEALLAREPDGSPTRAGHLSNLGNGLRQRYLLTGDADDLRRSIEAGTAAVDAAHGTDPDAPAYRSNLSSALRDRFDRDRDPADLDTAIELLEAAVGEAAQGDPKRPGYLSNLGTMRRHRAELAGDASDYDAAVEATAAAVDAARDGDPDLPIILTALALAHNARFAARGDPDDLRDTVAAAERATALAPEGSPDRARVLSTLSNALRLRFEVLGRRADLDAAVDLASAAVRAAPPGHVQRPAYLAHLANALHGRFEDAGALADLDQAVDYAAQAADAAARTGTDEGLHRANLCGFLKDRYDRDGRIVDLEGAVLAGRAAVAAMAGHAERATALSNLSNATLALAEETGGDPRAGVDLAAEALSAAAPGHPDRPRLANNLAAATLMLFERDGRPEDLDRALAASEEAVAATPPESVYRASRLGNLAQILVRTHARDGSAATLDRAFAAFAEGATGASAPALRRALQGRALARLAGRTGRWERARDAWAGVLELLPALVDRALSPVDRRRHLELLNGLGPEAAAAAITCGDLPGAWAALEAGRGVLLAQALQTRADDGRLERLHPDLYAELERLRSVLHAPSGDDSALLPALEAARRGAERRAAAEQWTALLERIRARPGLERFGLPPTFDELRAAAEGGTVVALIVTAAGLVALTLTADGAGRVPLDATEDEVVANVNALLAGESDPDVVAAGRRRADVLAWLRSAIGEPVLRHLGHTHAPPPGSPWPRVWWMPTGPLALLPIHAVALDHVVSSYTPTVATLRHQRARPGSGPVRRAVAVGVGEAAGLPRLRRAAAEARDVARRLGATPLIDAAATPSAVRAALPDATHAHFACHAVTDATDPGRGRLEVHAGSLSVPDLAALSVPRGELAYLSACATAFGGTVLLDESIHVASGLQLAGFRHVVGTLWPVSDDAAPGIAASFYAAVDAGADPASALHGVVLDLRRRHPASIALWASHVHFGP